VYITVMPTVSALPRRLCLGPGPSPVPPRVLAALATPTIGHLDPAFLALMDDLRAKLRTVFATANPMTLAMSGTGSAGMETVIVNLVEPGDRVVVGVNASSAVGWPRSRAALAPR
jgi:alanine-glyoxylate transaminase/serine-glyoxylate transaminase/serine-pyruvate transaminase